jgi:hypothetical protein
MADLKEFPKVGVAKESTIYGFLAHVVFMCGCGNPHPISLPYIPGMKGLATCPQCQSKIFLGAFQWQVGDTFPKVLLNVEAPSIYVAKS